MKYFWCNINISGTMYAATLKWMSFLIYYVAIHCFIFYVDVSYIYDWYKDRLFFNMKNNSVYDYVIGSAGSILATRLLNSGYKVILIEAGGNPGYLFNIPVLTPLLLNTEYDWKYKTVPQRHACKGLKNNQSSWSAGKIVGGSSRLNFMVHVQGHDKDYSSWFSDYREHLYTISDIMHFNSQNWYSKLADGILEGISELSYSLRNINEKSGTGFMRAQLTIKNGERWSTDRIINHSYHLYKRMTIITHTLVQKVLFKSNKAVGLEFIKNNLIYKVFARKGVILSAGAIGSPKLLMLSGIGPKKHLEELKIRTVVDLPVGNHLMDHIITGLDLVTINRDEALSIIDIINPYSAIDYYLNGQGPWTSAGVDVLGTFHSNHQNVDSAPDLQIMTFPVGLSQDNGILLKQHLGIPEDVFNNYFLPLVYKTAITIAPVLLHPKSYGSVKLRSSNPLDDPIIDPNYLSNKEDVNKLIQGIEFIKKLINTKSMRKLGAEMYEKRFPGCENIQFDTTTYWECYIRHVTLSTYHPAGTCGMGRVVDANFRVYGTRNLFVVDASVFQQLPSGNINTPVVALAEKAAKILTKNLRQYRLNTCYCNIKEIFLIH
ncbi:glucose dehydrogenase [FAD, quinone]-like isoform X2 [Phymastichus coffea]|uniref:glucose dehydrogenase [FAD, quinone]-like isoform X2 n=1 Tax=Phymastichus coffea TaxID=108790 RepID=UPI00273BCF48|nr:glucose dehydrogenase [FAD, quinone]-like isoform X2 [Phymastichus coffea]